MKRLPVGLVVAAVAVAAAATPARAQLPPELAQDVVAYYPFDETSGTVVNDRSLEEASTAFIEIILDRFEIEAASL